MHERSLKNPDQLKDHQSTIRAYSISHISFVLPFILFLVFYGYSFLPQATSCAPQACRLLMYNFTTGLILKVSVVNTQFLQPTRSSSLPR
jgi:hypothetical protein